MSSLCIWPHLYCHPRTGDRPNKSQSETASLVLEQKCTSVWIFGISRLSSVGGQLDLTPSTCERNPYLSYHARSESLSIVYVCIINIMTVGWVTSEFWLVASGPDCMHLAKTISLGWDVTNHTMFILVCIIYDTKIDQCKKSSSLKMWCH